MGTAFSRLTPEIPSLLTTTLLFVLTLAKLHVQPASHLPYGRVATPYWL